MNTTIEFNFDKHGDYIELTKFERDAWKLNELIRKRYYPNDPRIHNRLNERDRNRQ